MSGYLVVRIRWGTRFPLIGDWIGRGIGEEEVAHGLARIGTDGACVARLLPVNSDAVLDGRWGARFPLIECGFSRMEVRSQESGERRCGSEEGEVGLRIGMDFHGGERIVG